MHHGRRRGGVATRRDFLWQVARWSGAAVAGTMFAWDLLAADRGGSLRLEGRAPSQRNRVIVLGAGLGGMCVAYELRNAGYEVTVLEARARPGGRCWTIRRGTSETEVGGDKQVCGFAEGLFFNPGPMRISHHHATTLHYCREFGIELVAFPNVNEACWVHRHGVGKVRLREVRADWRGYTSELLAKTVRRDQLDVPLSAEDRERLIAYLRAEGRLDAALAYPRGDTSEDPSDPDNPRGYVKDPVIEPGEPTVPLDLEALIKSGYPDGVFPERSFNQQLSMLTPAGGMDRIAYGFASRLDDAIIYDTEAREIRRAAEGGVRIVCADNANGGALREVRGDWCVCTLPPVIARRIPSDFSRDAKTALNLPRPAAAGKIGLQFRRRFWEEDEGIYGGVSRTDLPISQVFYPFDGYDTAGPAVVIGYYHFGNAKAELDDQSLAERERRALAQGAEIHPQYPAEFENSFSVGWHRVPHSEMPWVEWNAPADDLPRAQRLTAAESERAPFFFAGDWLTYLNGWQAGALASAQKACRDLHARALRA